jgi:hypothetical protein
MKLQGSDHQIGFIHGPWNGLFGYLDEKRGVSGVQAMSPCPGRENMGKSMGKMMINYSYGPKYQL